MLKIVLINLFHWKKIIEKKKNNLCSPHLYANNIEDKTCRIHSEKKAAKKDLLIVGYWGLLEQWESPNSLLLAVERATSQNSASSPKLHKSSSTSKKPPPAHSFLEHNPDPWLCMSVHTDLFGYFLSEKEEQPLLSCWPTLPSSPLA